MQLATRLLLQQLSMKRKNLDDIKGRVHSGRCVNPECDSGQRPRARGLCLRCYTQFRKEMAAQSDDEARIRFEQRCITDGLILNHGEMRRFRRQATNPFARTAAAG